MKRHHPAAIMLAQLLGLSLVGCGREGIPGDPADESTESGTGGSGAGSSSSSGSSSSGSTTTGAGSTTTDGGGSTTSGGSGGDPLTQCYPAFWIPEGLPEPPTGWPAPWPGGEGEGYQYDPECTEWVEAFPEYADALPGIYTCSCMVVGQPIYGDGVWLAGWTQSGDECCFHFEPYTGGVEGRPFIVDGELRRADLELRSDWCDEKVSADVSRLDAAQRETIANAWLEAARLEHASVAAFSRHLLQLMALGAPAELIFDTKRAMDDELRHARVCFSIARAYGGLELGPKAFPLQGAPVHYDLLTVVREVLVEGCLGETLAAINAQRAAQQAKTPELRGHLERIAADEMEHAALAWRFVDWARTQDRVGVDALLIDLRRQLEWSDGPAADIQGEDEAHPEHGVLSASDKERTRRQARRQVVLPLVEAMLLQGHWASAAATSRRT